jgi:polyisoprenoid-binding protein YceI
MNVRKTRLIAISSFLAAATISLVAAAKLSKTGSATASFHATGPAGLSIDGKTTEVEVKDDGTTVSIVATLTNIDTGMGLRDKHTKEALEVTTYPTAKLDVARSALKFDTGSGDAKGKLTVHGQTKDVTFHYDAKKNGDTLDVTGKVDINVDDYGIKRPSYLGVTVKPDITINTTFSAKDN